MIESVRFDEQGLVPGIVQDARTRRVLMLGYLDRKSLQASAQTGFVHFWSRSRNQLWKKGETSGNTLRITHMAVDCDGDAVLIEATPAGPTCHTGNVSCFGVRSEAPGQGFASLEDLWDVIRRRSVERPTGSYTTQLLEGGVDAAGRKVVEEATELLLAAKDHAAGGDAPERIAEESADLMYHLLVVLAERGLEPAAMLEVLRERAG